MIYEDVRKAHLEALGKHDRVAKIILGIVCDKIREREIEIHSWDGIPDADSIDVIKKALKVLDEDLEIFKKANRFDKVEDIEIQKEILAKFLPKMDK